MGSDRSAVTARSAGIHYRGAVPPESQTKVERGSEYRDLACDTRSHVSANGLRGVRGLSRPRYGRPGCAIIRLSVQDDPRRDATVSCADLRGGHQPGAEQPGTRRGRVLAAHFRRHAAL